MKKLISRTLLLSMLLYLCLPIANYVYAKENIKVMINDVCIDDNAYIDTMGEKLYVSARSIAEPMGMNLEWNDFNKTLRISCQDTIISLIAASNVAIVDNTPIETEQPLKIVSDRAVVDLGFVCDVLESSMTFNETENTYCITIDVPEEFQADVIKKDNLSEEICLFSDDALEMSKVKDIAYDLELETIWDDTTKSLTLTSGLGDTLTLCVGDNIAWFNGDIVDCQSPLKIIDDEAYIEYEFIEKLFTVPTPQNYIPARQIADELGIGVEWIDETKTVEFVSENGDILCMSAGSCYYTLNNKFYSNSAPLVVKNGVALTDQAVVENAFVNHVTDNQNDEVTLFSNTKDFSGQLIFEKTFNSSTAINVTVISVQSIVYSNRDGFIYSDYDTKRITVPANTQSVDFCVTKTGCSTDDSYIIGYSFVNSNDYYYNEGYLSSSGGIVTYLYGYMYYYTVFDYYSSASNITIRPKVYSYVSLDDVVFSGRIKTNDGVNFGADSSLNVSVRSVTYYSESVIASQTLHPGNTSSAEFSISVPNNSSTRNKSLYLCYNLYDGDGNFVQKGYYKSQKISVKSRENAKAWNISQDTLSNISFIMLSSGKVKINGSFYMPTNMKNESNRDMSFAIDIQTVQSSVYSQKSFYAYASFDNVAVIKPGESKADYTLLVTLDEDNTYILKYRLNSEYQEIYPYGYATNNSNTTNPNYATLYTLNSDFDGIDFQLQTLSGEYTYINNLPYRHDGIIYSSSNLSERNTYYAGYYIYLNKGQTITIDMKSDDFDSYLYLLDDSMSVIAYDDDGLGYPDSRINREINKSGYYYIQAAARHSNITGNFSLNIKTDRVLSGDVIFTDANENVIQSIGNNAFIKANYEIKNTGSTPKEIYLFMALYDINDVLMSVETKNISVSGISNTELLTMDVRNFDNVGKIKTFMWTDELMPIGNFDYLYK